MSLRDAGVFAPIEADYGEPPCLLCDRPLLKGQRVALAPIETPAQSGSPTVEARVVHATCWLRGREIGTPKGRRVVDHIRDGDGSPFPVVTFGGEQWRDEEVTP